jgi:hypothetical protein
VQGAPAGSVTFPTAEPAQGAEVRMLGNARSLPFTWADGNLTVKLPDHLPAAPATAISIEGGAAG